MSSSDKLRARGWSCITEDSHGSNGEAAAGGGKESVVEGRRSQSGVTPRNGGQDQPSAKGGGGSSSNNDDSSSSVGQFADADEEEWRRDRDGRRLSRASPAASNGPRTPNTPPSSLKRRRSSGAESDEESDEDLFHVDSPYGRKDVDPTPPPKKDESGGGSRSKAEALALARSRLSKWASRLSDPDRPRLVEPPKSIPLNDEFLQAFGKRVQRDNSDQGKVQEIIDSSIVDDVNDSDKGGPIGATAVPTEPEAPTVKSTVSERKVKVMNLRYTTTQATLLQACQRVGEVEEINLIMDDDNDQLNKGRAYVTFVDVAGAQACLQQLTVLDGRTLRLALANENPASAGKGCGPSSSSAAAAQARYWLQDLATKCFRCGQVGHMERDCPNDAPPKPCALCAMTTHDLRVCPVKATCFNCGLSGHVGRECPTPRGRAVQRVLCTICLQSGHHRLQCRQGDAVQHQHRANARFAICMVCHQPGHYCCKDNKWFYGLDTLTCSNCGRLGHAGFQCDRPRLEVCSRLDNSHIVAQEIDRAATWTTAEEHFAERQLQSRRSPQGERSRGRSDSRREGRDANFQVEEARRAKSLPPQRYNNGTSVGRNEYQVESDYRDGRQESNRRDSYNRGTSHRNYSDARQYPGNGLEQGATNNGQRNHGGGYSNGNVGYSMGSPGDANNQKRSRWR